MLDGARATGQCQCCEKQANSCRISAMLRGGYHLESRLQLPPAQLSQRFQCCRTLLIRLLLPPLYVLLSVCVLVAMIR